MQFKTYGYRAGGYRPENIDVDWSQTIWMSFEYFLPWLYSKLFSLGWTFVSALVSYSPFLLMTLAENKMDELRWKAIQQKQLRAREDYAIEELSAYKDGDEQDQYVKQDTKEEEEEEEDEEKEQ